MSTPKITPHYITAKEVCPSANFINGIPAQLLEFATQLVFKDSHSQRKTRLISDNAFRLMVFMCQHAAFTSNGVVTFSLTFLSQALSMNERHLLSAIDQLESVKLLLRDSGYSDRTQNRYKIFMHTDLFDLLYFGSTSGKADISSSTKSKLSSSSTESTKDQNTIFINSDIFDVLEEENPSFEPDLFNQSAKYLPDGTCYYSVNRSQYAYFLKLMPTLPPFKSQAEVNLPPLSDEDEDDSGLPDIAF